MSKDRQEARKQLRRAKEQLALGDGPNLLYGALELRMAMESITYDRALAYKDELPPAEFDTWQPRKLLALLLEIDPLADTDSHLRIGLEPSPGEPPGEMHSLGTERVLNLRVLKRHYDALGSFLHVPSLKQREEHRTGNLPKLRARCEEVASFLTKVLASPVRNVTLGAFGEIECLECHQPVRKRMPQGVDVTRAECFQCSASYTVSRAGVGKVEFVPDHVHAWCANPACKERFTLWKREFKPGMGWTCSACSETNIVSLTVTCQASEPARACDPTCAGDSQLSR